MGVGEVRLPSAFFWRSPAQKTSASPSNRRPPAFHAGDRESSGARQNRRQTPTSEARMIPEGNAFT